MKRITETGEQRAGKGLNSKGHMGYLSENRESEDISIPKTWVAPVQPMLMKTYLSQFACVRRPNRIQIVSKINTEPVNLNAQRKENIY